MIKDWKELFDHVKGETYSRSLKQFLDAEYQKNVIYPPRDMVFQAFKLTAPKDLKVVIIGQDPYHNPGQAMGLSFSVPRGMEIPPSLVNIYKEIQNDIGLNMNFDNGDLTPAGPAYCLYAVGRLCQTLCFSGHQPQTLSFDVFSPLSIKCQSWRLVWQSFI